MIDEQSTSLLSDLRAGYFHQLKRTNQSGTEITQTAGLL